MTEHQEYLSLSEAAQLLGVTVRTVARYAHDSGLPVVKLGAARNSTVRISRGDLDAWVAARRKVTGP